MIMKICFAVQKDEGLESTVYGHFGSAPAFMVVDTENKSTDTISNRDMIHAHGACNPIMALDGRNVDAIVVGGIGGGALMKLNAAGIKVYGSMAGTIKGNIDLLMKNGLPELSMENACAGHEGGCGH